MHITKYLCGVLAVSALVLGCTRDRASIAPTRPARAQSPPTARGGGPPTLESAIDRLGTARCDREARCGRLGSEGSYDTRDQCLSADLMSRLDALDPATCPNGIDPEILESCIEAMHSGVCGLEVQSAGCTVQSLCGH